MKNLLNSQIECTDDIWTLRFSKTYTKWWPNIWEWKKCVRNSCSTNRTIDVSMICLEIFDCVRNNRNFLENVMWVMDFQVWSWDKEHRMALLRLSWPQKGQKGVKSNSSRLSFVAVNEWSIKFLPLGQTVTAVFYLAGFKRLRKRIARIRPPIDYWKSIMTMSPLWITWLNTVF